MIHLLNPADRAYQLRFLARMEAERQANWPVTDEEIAVKQQSVRKAYSEHGFHSRQYQNGFDELHNLRMRSMAQKYRLERGLPPGSKTPYCS
ncbi:MAG: hypothetical protein LC131_06870 [Anaerolineae bacterium]|nr:hypothetical protein [Anaerolineae bacterium]